MNDAVFVQYDMGCIADNASNWQVLLDILRNYPQLFASFRVYHDDHATPPLAQALGCSICSAPSPSWVCSQCGDALYCNRVCQRRHWVSGHGVKCSGMTAE